MLKYAGLVFLLGAASIQPAYAMQMTRYLGTPDLPLTAALVQAGGGPQHFDSLKLLGVLAGTQTNAEVASLTRRYGKVRVADFVVTFNHAIDDALTTATKAGVTLPAPAPRAAQNGKVLWSDLVAAGTMPGGRFDVGYMLEHLVSRNIHVAIMHQLDADPKVGPQRNADFHTILTTVIADLRPIYTASSLCSHRTAR